MGKETKKPIALTDFSKVVMPEQVLQRGVNTQYNLSRGIGESEQDALAREQGTLDAFGNILGRFLGRTGLSILETGNMIQKGIPAAISSGKLSTLFDNESSRKIEEINQSLVEKTPFYNTESEDKADLFSTNYLSSPGFWGNLLGEGGGFVAGAALSGMGTGAILKGLTLGAKAASAGVTASRLGKMLSLGTEANVLKEAAKSGTIANKISSFLKNKKFQNTVLFQTQETLGNMYEAGVEAKGIKDGFIANKIAELKSQYGEQYQPTATQLAEIEDEANTYANVGFITNLALLKIDGMNYTKLFSGYKNTKRTINALQKEGKYVSKEGWRKMLDSAYLLSKGALKEMGQEGGQFLTESTLTDEEFNKKSGDTALVDWLQATVKGAEETFGTKEGKESMLAGFLLGGGMSAKSGYKDIQWDKKGIELLNDSLTRDSLSPIIRNVASTIKNNEGDLSNSFAESNSKYAFLAAKDKDYYKWINARILTGRVDDAISDLQAFKSMPIEEFNKAHGVELSEEKRNKIIDDLLDSTKKITKVYDDVESTYSNHPYKNMLVQNLSQALLIDKRIKAVQSKLVAEENPLERELLASDLGFLQEDKKNLNNILLALVAGEKVDSSKNTIPTPKEVRVKSPITNEETKGTLIGEQNGQTRVDTKQGTVITGLEDIFVGKEGFTGKQKLVENEEPNDREYSEFEDSPEKSFMEDPEDENSAHMNWSDFQINSNANYDTSNVTDPEKLKEINANKQLAQQIHDTIIDSGLTSKDNYTFYTEQEGDNTNVFAKPKKGGSPIKLGYFNNLETSLASNAGGRTMMQFLKDYLPTANNSLAKGLIAQKLAQALEVLKGKTENITKFLRLVSRIDNNPLQGVTSFADILNSPFLERWKVNGELLLVQNNNGTYEVVNNLKKENLNLVVKELSNPKTLNSLGTQFAILVKRPDSKAYQFIGLKGRALAQEEIEDLIKEIKDLQSNPEITPDNIKEKVAILNEKIFLATSERFINQDGQEVPIHIEFFVKQGTKNIAVWATEKIVNGAKKKKGQSFGKKTFRSGEEMYELIRDTARVKIQKNSEESRDLDFLGKNLVTSAKPNLWNTFFRFNHQEFLKSKGIEHPVEENTKQAESLETPVVSLANKKADIEIGKVGNTEYEVKVDGVYYQGKKLNNPENKTHRQLIEADIERRSQEELNNRNITEANTDGKWDVAAEYLLNSGTNTVLSTDYYLLGVAGAFSKITGVIDNIRNKYAKQLADNNLVDLSNAISSKIFDKINSEIRIEIEKIYGKEGAEQFDKIAKSPTGLVSRIGNEISSKISEIEDEINSKINAKYDAELAALGQAKTPKQESTLNELDNFLDSLPDVGESTTQDPTDLFKISIDEDEEIEEEKIIANLAAITGFKVEFRQYADPTIKGEFRDNVIILNQEGFPKGTEYHEAFHAIFSILPKTEQERVLRIAYEKLGLTPSEYNTVLENYRNNISPEQFAKLTKDRIISIALEEKLADMFQEYMNKDTKPFILSDFFTRFKNLVKSLFGLIDQDDFKVLFERITSGEFKNISTSDRKVISRYKIVPKANKTQSQQLIDGIAVAYLNKTNTTFLNTNEYLKESPSDLKSFIELYIKNQQQVERNKVLNFKNDLETAFANKKITQKEYEDRANKLKNRLTGNYNKELYPTYLETTPELISTLEKIIKKYYDLSKIRKINTTQKVEGSDINDIDPETEDKEEMFNKPEFESNPKDTAAAQMLIKYFKQMFIIDNNNTEPIGATQAQSIYNNLLFRLSAINKKDYEGWLEEQSQSGNTKYNKIITNIYNLYTTDDLFKNNFDTAFDRTFATLYDVYSDVYSDVDATGKKEFKTKTVAPKTVAPKNLNDYLKVQLADWEKETFNRVITNADNITQALGIILEPNTFTDPDGANLINSIMQKLATHVDKPSADFISSNKGLFVALGNINIKYRLDLNELTARNAKNKSIYSFLNNSWIIEKLQSYGKKWGVYTGSRFNGNKMDYSDLDPRSMFLTTFSMWLNTGDDKKRNSLYFTQQLEAKSTNFMFEGSNYSMKYSDIKNILIAEAERQSITHTKVEKELRAKEAKFLVEGYHYLDRIKKTDGEKETIDQARERTLLVLQDFADDKITREKLPRGLQYHNLPKANGKISEEVVTEDKWEALKASMYKNMLEELNSSRINGETLQTMFKVADPKNTLKEFLVDQYLNRMQIIAHITPDLGQFKSYVDITKRGGGLAASGPNHGTGVMKFGIFKDIKSGDINTTDAQGIETISERINRLVKLGRLAIYDNTIDEVNSQMYSDWKLLDAYERDDRDYIRKFDKHNDNALLKVEKTVGYNDDYYIKSSVTVLTRYVTSILANKDETITREVNGEIKTYTAFQDTVNGNYYLPKVGAELSWMNMNKMQKSGLAALFAESAIKKNVHSTIDSRTEEDYIPHNFDYAYYRLQQENPSGKEEIKDGSQMIQLIDAYFQGAKDIAKTMDEIVATLKQHNYDIYGPELKLIIKDQVYDPFIEHVQSAVEGSAMTDRLEEFFEVSNGEFKNSSSLPIIKEKFEQYMMSYFSNKIALHKTSGNKCTLVTSQFKGVAEINGKVYSDYEMYLMSEIENSPLYNPTLAKSAKSRELKWVPDEGGYAEAIVSEEYITQMGFTIDQFYTLKKNNPVAFEKLSRALVYRIPTQAQHSMLPIKIVDILPNSYGSTIILPKEITAISGADYDVDSVFIHKPEVYKKGSKIDVFSNNKDSKMASYMNNSIISDVIDMLGTESLVPIKTEIQDIKNKIRALSKRDQSEERDLGISTLDASLQVAEQSLKDAKEGILLSALDLLREKFPDNKYYDYDSKDYTNPESLKNQLLEKRLEILSSPEGTSLINNPAKDFFTEIYTMFESAGFPNPKSLAKKYMTYSGQDNMSYEYRKVATGFKAIGGSANMSKVFAFLQKNGIELNPEIYANFKTIYPELSFNISDRFEEDIELVFNEETKELEIKGTKNKLKSDTLSNNVSITVDNAKDQTLIKYFLTDKNIAEASTLAGLGFGINRLALFLQQPISKRISSFLSISSNEVWESPTFQDNVDKIDKYLKQLYDKGARLTPLSDEKLLSSVKNYEVFKNVEQLLDKKELTEAELEYLNIQYSIGALYAETAALTKDAYKINTILNFNKTIGSEVNDLLNLRGAFASIEKTKLQDGIPVSTFSFEPSNLTSNSVYSQVKQISENLENRVRGNSSTKSLMIAYSKQITKFINPFMYASKHKLINPDPSNPESVSVGLDSTDKKFQAKLAEEFLDFLAINLVKNKVPFDLSDPEIINGNRVIAAYNAASEFLHNYEIGQLMKVIKTGKGKPFPFDRVTVESFSKPTPELENAIMDSYDDMLISSNTLVKQLAIELGKHVASHDNYRYVASSVVSKMRSKYFSKINDVYKDLENIINSGEDVFEYTKQITNLNKNYLRNNFIKYFLLDKRVHNNFNELTDKSVINKETKTYLEAKAVKDSKDFYFDATPQTFDKVIAPAVLRKVVRNEAGNIISNSIHVLEQDRRNYSFYYRELEIPEKTYKAVQRQLPYEAWLALVKKQPSYTEKEYSDDDYTYVEPTQEEEKTEVRKIAVQEKSSNLEPMNKEILFAQDTNSGYAERTKRNASADATIAIAVDFTSAGERLTRKSVEEQKKKYIPVHVTTSLDGIPLQAQLIVRDLNLIAVNPFDDNGISLNIAGNGIYTMKGKYTQKEVDEYTYNLLKAIIQSPTLKNKITSIRTGGQTGFDEAGAKAGIKLGIKTYVLAPKGWKFRDINSNDISNEQAFKARFGVTNTTQQLAIPFQQPNLDNEADNLLKDSNTINIGSKQDIEGFKKFVEQPINKEIKPNEYEVGKKEADTKEPIEQNFFDGYRPNSDTSKVHTIRPEITSKYGKGVKTFTLVKEGVRTRTTRLKNWMANNNPKVGDYFWQVNKKNPNDKILTRITAVYKNSDPRFKDNWFKEGWVESDFEYVKNYDSAVEFEVVNQPTEIKPKFSIVNNKEVSLPEDLMKAQQIDPNITAEVWSIMSDEEKQNWFKCNK